MSYYKFKTKELLTPEAELEFLIMAQEGDVNARQILHERNLRFVIKVAFEYKNIVAPEDVIGEGVLGLDHAINKFETDRGLKFITFAVYWIRAHITQYLKDKKSTIRIPVNQQEEIRKAKKQKDGITPEIQKMMNLQSRGVALDKPVSGEGVSIFQDFLEDPDTSKNPGFVPETKVMSFVDGLLKRLPNIEARILKGLFALETEKKTLRDLAEELNISHERVRQLKNQALNKISKFDDAPDILDTYLGIFGR